LKILIITPRIPYPPFRGDKLKIYNLSKILNKNNDVYILTFLGDLSEEKDLELLKKENISIEAIKQFKYSSLINLIKSFFTSAPFQISYYYSKKMRNRITELTSINKYDVVYFHLINSAQYYEAVKNKDILKVIDFTDSTSLYLTRYLEFLKNPFRRLFFSIELKRILKYEQIVKKFDTLFVCSSVDKQFLIERNVHNNIQILLNGFDIDTFRFEKIKKEKGRIVFVGNMTYFPNIDAVVYFSNEIFPLILNKIPEAKLYIVGQNPTKEVIDLQSDNIIITGFVEDLKKEYLVSEVNIAPIRFGSGTLNKIIEAIALGIPIVATSLASQGFPSELKKYIHIKDHPKEIADEIISILSENDTIGKKLIEGREVISQMLSWEKIVKDFENYLKKRINRKIYY